MKLLVKDLELIDRWWFTRTVDKKLHRNQCCVGRVLYMAKIPDVYGAFVQFENYIKFCFEI